MNVSQAAVQPVELLVPKVLATYPHDPTAFTEGLFLADDHFYESSGQYGQSTMREVDPTTGKVLASTSLPAEDFAEGIALVGDHIFQLTWREGGGFIYDRATLKVTGTFQYNDEGWGMCYDGSHLYTSDGSDEITERTSDTLTSISAVTVRYQGLPVDQINELECVGDTLYANVWHTDEILRIDKATGTVTGLIDASGLLTADQRKSLTSPEAVLNGIAYNASDDTFFITGKLWPWMFKVQFVDAS
ncbi:MAG TPA: glutaminyl-peptide cyclotransferase [Phototrophicaceae bacterium]|nr:glutaminyl-peptide cyclotransferase [Phototrophicaceae bacterium]